jgi:hypothetical protein
MTLAFQTQYLVKQDAQLALALSDPLGQAVRALAHKKRNLEER